MKNLTLIFAFLLGFTTLYAQRNPIELIVGQQRISADVTLAKTIDPNGKLVLFNRSRYLVPNDRTAKPTFGTSLGFLYQLKGGLYAGFLGSANSGESTLRTGFYGRYKRGDFSVRSVLLTVELRQNPNFDSWAIFNFSPQIAKQWQLFSQVELAGRRRITDGVQQSAVRSRLGLGYKNFQFGAPMIGNNDICTQPKARSKRCGTVTQAYF
jgi:hypothetical protein